MCEYIFVFSQTVRSLYTQDLSKRKIKKKAQIKTSSISLFDSLSYKNEEKEKLEFQIIIHT